MNIQEKFKEKYYVARLNARDQKVFEDVYDHYIDRVYRYIFFKVPTQEDAEDLTSEVFFKAWQYIYTHERRIEYLNAFLFQIARNTVVDFYRRKTNVESLSDEETMRRIEDYRQQNLLAGMDNKADIREIERVLKSLKDEYREVIVLKYIEELSTAEISKILNKSKGAVRILVHRAMTILRKNIPDSNEKK